MCGEPERGPGRTLADGVGPGLGFLLLLREVRGRHREEAGPGFRRGRGRGRVESLLGRRNWSWAAGAWVSQVGAKGAF